VEGDLPPKSGTTEADLASRVFLDRCRANTVAWSKVANPYSTSLSHQPPMGGGPTSIVQGGDHGIDPDADESIGSR